MTTRPAGLDERQTAALLQNQVVAHDGRLHYLAGDNRNANYPDGNIRGVSWATDSIPGYCSKAEAYNLSCPDGIGGDDWPTRRAQNQRNPESYEQDPYQRAKQAGESMAGGVMAALALVALVIAGLMVWSLIS